MFAKRFSSLWVLIICIVFTPTTIAQESHTLRDIIVFGDERYGTWAGSDLSLSLETEDWLGSPSLPIDTSMTYNDLPSLRVSVTGECCDGWWGAVLAGWSWESYDIEPYVANGALEFNIRGDANIDNLWFQLLDVVNPRTPTTITSNQINIRNYVTLTEDWQSVRIPLSAFIDGTEFVPTQTSGINFGSSADATGTFWLNNIRFTSPDSEPAIPAIKINLIGYQPDAPKYALITGPNLTFPKDTPFSITPANSDEEIHSGVLNGITDFDPASGDSIYIANFDELTEQGLYRLHIEGLETSPVFRIGTNIYDNLLVDTMRYFYMQRQGIELDFQTAGAFERGIGHPLDTVAEFASGAFPARDVSGGWYDAGDYGKYVNAGAAAISDLLWAYRLFPDAFQDNQFNIPESGNGVPDLLDEVRWELEWLLKMQDPNEGGFWTRVGPTEFGQPDESTHTRTIEDTDGERVNVQPTGNTASAVAALAMAAPFYREIDPLFADELIAAAELGWQYLENHPETVLSIPGAYADDEDTQERLWAAAALYATTNSESAHAYYLANYQNFAQLWQSETDNAYGIVIMGMVAFLEYGFSENPDPEALAWFTQQYGTWRTMMLERAEAPWRTTLLDEDYYWGSNSAAISTVNTLYIADLITQQDTANTITIAHQTLNYILGINPLRLSYISGYGVDSIERPHSALWSSDDIVPIPAGVLVGGPNEYTNPFLYSAFPAKRFSDSDHNWSTNEHTIYWNAQLVFMIALLQP